MVLFAGGDILYWFTLYCFIWLPMSKSCVTNNNTVKHNIFFFKKLYRFGYSLVVSKLSVFFKIYCVITPNFRHSIY